MAVDSKKLPDPNARRQSSTTLRASPAASNHRSRTLPIAAPTSPRTGQRSAGGAARQQMPGGGVLAPPSPAIGQLGGAMYDSGFDDPGNVHLFVAPNLPPPQPMTKTPQQKQAQVSVRRSPPAPPVVAPVAQQPVTMNLTPRLFAALRYVTGQGPGLSSPPRPKATGTSTGSGNVAAHAPRGSRKG